MPEWTWLKNNEQYMSDMEKKIKDCNDAMPPLMVRMQTEAMPMIKKSFEVEQLIASLREIKTRRGLGVGRSR
eukprot:8524121-Pyramimonas_sp.AAC.1